MPAAKTYLIKEIFGPTVQGEAAMAGVACHFVRMSACNMWDGRPETRAASQCPYCDTDFFGGDKLTALQIVNQLHALGGGSGVQWVWVSGGEPALQIDQELVDALHGDGWNVAIETNGTQSLGSLNIDHVTVSPKVPRDQIKLEYADTLKLLYPHPNPLITPEAFADFPADHHYLQPIDAEDPAKTKANTDAAIQKIYGLPDEWRLSLQTHKWLELK